MTKAQTFGCLCGGVRITVAKQPTHLNDCNCKLCRNAGALWGYYHPDDVRIEGAKSVFRRTDIDDPVIDLHFCAECSAAICWRGSAEFVARRGEDDKMAVNMHLCAPDFLNGVELRFHDGANWNGDAPPKMRKPSVTLGEDWKL